MPPFSEATPLLSIVLSKLRELFARASSRLWGRKGRMAGYGWRTDEIVITEKYVNYGKHSTYQYVNYGKVCQITHIKLNTSNIKSGRHPSNLQLIAAIYIAASDPTARAREEGKRREHN